MTTLDATPAGARAPAGPERVWDPARRRLTVGLVMTITLVAFESLAIATVMPTVEDDLGGRALYGWVFSGFFLASLAGIVVTGLLTDRRGPMLPFAGGLVLFSIGLVVGGLAPSMAVLVAARLAQGFGAGAIPSSAYASVARGYPPALRPRVFAIFSTAWVIPGITGPTIATFVEEAASWHWVFLGLLPLVLVAGLIAVPALGRLDRAPSETEPQPLDAADARVVGAATPVVGASPPVARAATPTADAATPIVGAITPVVGAVGAADAVGPADVVTPVVGAAPPNVGGSPPVVGTATPVAGATAPAVDGEPVDGRDRLVRVVLLVVGVGLVLAGGTVGSPVLTAVLIAVGLPVAIPAFLRLVPVGTTRLRPGLPAIIAVRGLLTWAFFGVDAYVSLAATEGRGGSTRIAGAALSVCAVLWTCGSWSTERLLDRLGPRTLDRIGFLLIGLGSTGMLATALWLSAWWALPAWGIGGLGMGLAYSPLSVSTLGAAEPGREGQATASLQLCDTLGVSLGTGAGGALIALADGQGWASSTGVALVFGLGIAASVGGLLAATRLPSHVPATSSR